MKCPNCDFIDKDEAFGDPATCPECGAIYEKALKLKQFKQELEAQKAANAAQQEAPAKAESWLAKGLKGASDGVKKGRSNRKKSGAKTLYTEDGAPVLVGTEKRETGCLRPIAFVFGVIFLVSLFSATSDNRKGYQGSPEPIKTSINTTVCDGKSVVIGEVLRPLRNAPLRVGSDKDSQLVTNEKGSKATGTRMYHGVDSDSRVLAHCEKSGATYVTFIEPEWLKGLGGWVETELLREKRDLGNPYEGLISERVLEKYEDYEIIGDSSHPRSGRFLGKDDEINAQKVAAAKRAIDSGRCEYVSYVYFQPLESASDNPRYEVECEQDKRITLASNDLSSGVALRTNEERAISRSAALGRCKELVRSQVVRKSAARYHEVLGVSYYVFPASGNVRQVLDFDAQNGLGQTIRHRAVCIFDPDGGEEITILEK